jgi:hypothetical protein
LVLNHLLTFGELGTPLVHEGEAPDFVLDFGDQRVGVEVTQYVRGRSSSGSAQRKQHAFIQRVLDEANALLRQQMGDPIYVTVDVLDGRTAANAREVARQLTESVRHCLEGESLPPRPFPFGLNLAGSPQFYECAVPDLMAPIADRITVVRLHRGSYTHWHIRQSGNTKASVQELEALIASKDPDTTRYTSGLDAIWLAIDAFGGDILQAITPTRDLVERRYRTHFDRIFLVDTTETTIHQLWTEKSDKTHGAWRTHLDNEVLGLSGDSA